MLLLFLLFKKKLRYFEFSVTMQSESEGSPEQCVYNRRNDPKELKISKLRRMIARAMTRLAKKEEALYETKTAFEKLKDEQLKLNQKLEKCENEKKMLTSENEKLLYLIEEMELLNHKI